MSELIQCDVDIRDQGVLIDSLVEIGVPRSSIEVFPQEKPGQMNGYGSRKRTAHVVVRKGTLGSTYADIGFEFTPDGCKIHADHMDISRGVAKKIGQPEIGGSGELTKIYQKNVVIKSVRRNGRCRVASTQDNQGRVKIRITM